MMLTIALNGENTTVNEKFSLADLLHEKKIMTDYIAVAVNREFIAKANYQTYQLKEGDKIECVTPMQGG
jgi:sulfur carrier protein